MRKAHLGGNEPADDGWLLDRAREGHADAFERLFERHWETVYRVAHRLLRDDAAAEDVTQEVFVIAYRKLGSFRGDALFSTWLHRIAVNRALEWNRKDGRRRERPLEDAGEVDESALAEGGMFSRRAGGGDAASEVEAMELREALWSAIDALPPRQRTVFLLRTGEELPFHEIAAMLGKSVGGSKANFHLAVRNLRRALGGRYGER